MGHSEFQLVYIDNIYEIPRNGGTEGNFRVKLPAADPRRLRAPVYVKLISANIFSSDPQIHGTINGSPGSGDNNAIGYAEAGTNYITYITPGNYTPYNFPAQLENDIANNTFTTAGVSFSPTNTYTISYSETTGKFTFTQATGSADFNFYTSAATTGSGLIGLSGNTETSSTSAKTSDIMVNLNTSLYLIYIDFVNDSYNSISGGFDNLFAIIQNVGANEWSNFQSSGDAEFITYLDNPPSAFNIRIEDDVGTEYTYIDFMLTLQIEYLIED
jgi:hypothetical protein